MTADMTDRVEIIGNELEMINELVRNHNNHRTIRNIATGFIRKGLDRTIPLLVFGKDIEFSDLSNHEKLCFVEGLYRATKVEIINPKRLFEKEFIEEYNDTDLSSMFIPLGLKNPSDMELLKIEYINNNYGNKATQANYWQVYKQYIMMAEKHLNKDLYDFSESDIRYVLTNVYGSISTKYKILSFINKYMEYCLSQSLISENTMRYVNTTELAMLNSSAIKSKYISFDDTYSLLISLIEKNKITLSDAVYGLLVRSGMTVAQLVDLKFEHIDNEINMVKIARDGYKMMSLDPRVIDLIDKHYVVVEMTGGQKGNTHKMHILEGHLIKLTGNQYDKTRAFFSVKRRMSKISEASDRDFYEYMLNMSFKIDILDKIKESRGKLLFTDFQAIQEMFGLSKTACYRLKTEYDAVKDES